jgi:electron transfer flavoprotein alpha subunit
METNVGDVLAVVEQRDGVVRGVAHEVVSTAARVAEALGGEAHALVIGPPGVGEAAAALGQFGASTVHAAEHDALSGYNPEGYASVAATAAGERSYAAVLFGATAQGRDLAPRVAARLDVPLAADVTQVEVRDGVLDIVRPVYAGKAFARLRFEAAPVVLSLRPNVFPLREGTGAAVVEQLSPDVDASSWGTRVLEFRAAAGGDVDVAEASIVVSGGRGMKDPSRWQVLEELRDALGSDVAALGASRAVVDAGWRPHGEQVGQTGKTVSPKLYFAVGISGAIQHLAGMRTAGTIVAVNKDPDAPIFGVADYGVVGDLFEVVPRLTQEIRALRVGD